MSNIIKESLPQLKYDFTGNVIGRKLIHRHASGAVVEERYTHTYDAMGRPLETSHKVDDAPWRTVSSLAYDHIGRAVSEKRNGVSALKSGFTYNIRSWMTGVSGTLFSEVLRYQDGPAPQWGGMISEMEWRSGAEAFCRKYSFVYDGLSRLMSAGYGGDEVAGAFSESYSYDRNGNMTSLLRHGLNAQGTGKATLVSISPSYSGNRLSAIGDSVFSYDAKGRQTASSYGGNSAISYNVLDLPLRMTLPGGISIDYAYSADGRKLMEKVSGVSAAVTRDYCGTLLYEGGALKKIFFGGGYVDMGGQSPSYHFFLCDHLGSVRAVASEDGMVEQVSHYYPFGSRFSDPRTAPSSSDNNRMLFTGKELGAENGLYDFSARFLDPILGRFTTMDPLAEKCPDISPYAYCAGDPVNALDPDGRDWFKSERNNIFLWKDNPDQQVEGYSYFGPAGSVLGDFEVRIDTLMTSVYKIGSLFLDGRSFEIADKKKGAFQMLGDFLFNSGNEITILTPDHPYTKVLIHDPSIVGDECNYVTTPSGYGVAHSFGYYGFKKAGTNMALQFIGSYRHDMNETPNGQFIYHVVSDSKSRTSLFYHLPMANKSRGESRFLGNTYQFYIWVTFNEKNK